MTDPFYALQKLRASDLNAILAKGKTKTSDESVNSGSTGTTLHDDNTLFVAVSANVTYQVTVDLLASEAAGTGIDIKMAWTFPTGAILDLAVTAVHEAWVATAGSALEAEWAGWQNETSSPSSTKTFGTFTTVFSYRFGGRLRVGSTAGTLQLQWAQKNSSASNLTMESGSSITLLPVLR